MTDSATRVCADSALRQFISGTTDFWLKLDSESFPIQERWRLASRRNAGVPIHSDEAPRVDVHSDAFKAWFADSVVAMPDGQPRRFWHGTFQDFESFDHIPETHPAHRQSTAGIYFTAWRNYACTYGYNIMEVCLKVRRPYVTFDYDEILHVTDGNVAQLRRGGYDAIVYNLPKYPDFMHEICVFSPDQVRLIRRVHIGGLDPRETS